MRVSVDLDRCCGAGMCALTAPAVFDQDEQDGIVVLRDAQPPEQAHRAVLEAEQLCPSGAISVEEARP